MSIYNMLREGTYKFPVEKKRGDFYMKSEQGGGVTLLHCSAKEPKIFPVKVGDAIVAAVRVKGDDTIYYVPLCVVNIAGGSAECLLA